MIKARAITAFLKLKALGLRHARYPRNIMFFITSACNAACPHCFFWKKSDAGDMPDEAIIRVIDALPKLKTLCLTGGEPTLRTNIQQIISTSLKKSKMLSLNTNGILTEKIQSLSEAFLARKARLHFQISIDGEEQTHDAIRGKNAYQKTLNTIKLLNKLGYYIIVVVTLSMRNTDEIQNIFKTLFGLVSEIRINIVRSSDNSVWLLPKNKLNTDHRPRENHLLLSTDELKRLYDKLIEINKQYPLWSRHNQMLMRKIIDMHERPRKNAECFAGKSEAVIYPDGGLTFCEFYTPFLSLKDYDFNFKSAWKSRLKKDNLNFISKCFCVHSCNLSTAISLSPEYVIESLNAKSLLSRIRTKG